MMHDTVGGIRDPNVVSSYGRFLIFVIYTDRRVMDGLFYCRMWQVVIAGGKGSNNNKKNIRQYIYL